MGHIPAIELRQAANLGLAKAVRRYDAERGPDFLALALRTIRQEIRRHVRASGAVLRPPDCIEQIHARMGTAVPELTDALHRPPTVVELAQGLGAPLDDVLWALLLDDSERPCEPRGYLTAERGRG